jgi:hypothetical protein
MPSRMARKPRAVYAASRPDVGPAECLHIGRIVKCKRSFVKEHDSDNECLSSGTGHDSPESSY